jgi:hypothetical protein
MKTRRKLIALLAALTVLVATAGYAGILGDIVKVGGIGYVVEKFGGQINDFVNKLTLNNKMESKQYTAVVPILTVGSGGYVGAAQVMGNKKNVQKCKAVVQIEGNALFGKNIRAKALVPVDAKSVTNIKRVDGVGVSAIIDIRI